MINKCVQLLTYALLLLFPFGLLLRVKLFANVALVPQDIVVALIAILVLLNIKKVISKNYISLFYKLQILFLGFGTISLIANYFIHNDINIIVSFLYTLRYFFYLHLIFVPLFFKKREHLYSGMLISGSLLLFVGFVQYFFYSSLKSLFILGWDEHLYRLFSSFLDPNFASVYFVLFLIFLLNTVVKKSINISYKEVCIAFFTSVAIFVTYSRTGLVAMIVGIGALGVFYKKYKLLFVGFVMALTMLFVVSDVSVEGLNPFRTASTNLRLHAINDSAHVISKNPLIGVGLNAYRYAQLRYHLRTEVGIEKSNADASTDNSFLFVIATTGILGFLIFIASYVKLLTGTLKRKKGYFLFCSCLVLMVSALFTNTLFYTPILTWFFLTFNVSEDK